MTELLQSRRPVLGIAALAFAAVLAGCAQNPATGGNDFVTMSEDQELAIGREAHNDVLKEYPPYDDADLQAYVEEVGQRLAVRSHRPDLVYRFTVVDSPEVNAFALPGGYIYITRGMLAHLNSEAEMAGVLAHEIGHVTARHGVRQQAAQQAAGVGYLLGSILLPELRGAVGQNAYNLLGGALIRGYGREMELEADGFGSEYLAQAGYDPEAIIDVIRALKAQEQFEVDRAKSENREPNVYHGLFSTHPDSDTRLKQVVDKSRGLRTGAQPRVGRDAYLGKLDGVVYGPGVRQGVLRNNRFYHRDLGISMRFPGKWRVENRPDRLVAVPPGNDALLQVTLEDINKRISPKAFLTDRLKVGPLRDGKDLDANGLDGYTARAVVDTPFGRRLTRFSVVYLGKRAYVFAGAHKAGDDEEKYRAQFLATARSLHALTDDERELARERRIRVRRADQGTRYEALAKESALSQYPEAQLRLINGQYPDGQPGAGTLVKVIE